MDNIDKNLKYVKIQGIYSVEVRRHKLNSNFASIYGTSNNKQRQAMENLGYKLCSYKSHGSEVWCKKK